MSTKAHQFRIGIFVLCGMALVVFAIIAFGAGALAPEEVFWAETYLDASVQGLEVGSPVKLRGVEIGRVEMITFVDKVYDVHPEDFESMQGGRYVLVRMALFKEALHSRTEEELHEVAKRMIDAGLRVRVASQGFTGVRYIEAEMLDPERYPPLDIVWEPEVLYVPSAHGVLSEIVDSIDLLTRKLEALPFDKLTGEVQSLVRTLQEGIEDADIADVSGKIQDLIDGLKDATGSELVQTIEGANELIGRLNSVVGEAEIGEALDNFKGTTANLKRATQGLPETLERLDRSVQRIDSILGGEEETLRATLHDLHLTLQNLRELSDTAKRYPASVLFGKSPPPSRPEEEP